MNDARACLNCGAEFEPPPNPGRKPVHCSNECRVTYARKLAYQKKRSGELCSTCTARPPRQGRRTCERCAEKAIERRERTPEERAVVAEERAKTDLELWREGVAEDERRIEKMRLDTKAFNDLMRRWAAIPKLIDGMPWKREGWRDDWKGET